MEKGKTFSAYVPSICVSAHYQMEHTLKGCVRLLSKTEVYFTQLLSWFICMYRALHLFVHFPYVICNQQLYCWHVCAIIG